MYSFKKLCFVPLLNENESRKKIYFFNNVLPSIYGKGYYKGYCIEQKHVATKMDHKPMVDDKKNICLNFSQSMLFTKKAKWRKNVVAFGRALENKQI